MGIWSTAKSMAEQTPAQRSRYIDFLRAMSILFVISGHWLIATAVYDMNSGQIVPVDVLKLIPSTQWLSWLFQVMPVFFIVGGYSNAISLQSAEQKKLSYNQWLTGRLHRLLTPLLVLIVFWAFVALVLNGLGVQSQAIVFGSRAAMVPTWFLAIYTMIVMLAPLSYTFWRRWGYASFFVFGALACSIDFAYIVLGQHWLGWSNYFWVWLAVHQLGYAWHDDRLAKPPLMLLLAIASLALLAALIFIGPYPLAMAGSPDDGLSNTLPPKITLIALGLAQLGLFSAIEQPMRRWLANLKLWTLTVLINSMIMSVYLWHMTILVSVLGLGYLLEGFGLGVEPGSTLWWQSRPLWLLVLALLLIPVALAFSPLERRARPSHLPVPSSLRLVAGAMCAGLGIALASLKGFSGAPQSLASWTALILLLAGCWISGVRMFFKKAKQDS